MSYSQVEEKFLENFGCRIRELRRNKGWSQEQLADKSDLHRTYIGSIERGERNVSILNVRKLAFALDIPLSILMDF